MLPNKGMKLTKLRAAPVRQAEVPPCARAARMGAGTASQLIPGVRRTPQARGRARDGQKATRGTARGEMEGDVEVWLLFALMSALMGFGVAKLIKNPLAVLVAAGIAWFSLLGWLLYYEYFVPYQGGGASMWQIAQMFGGTFLAIVAGGTAAVVVALTPKRRPEDSPDGHDAKRST